MTGIKKNTNELKDTVISVKDLISPIVNEMEGEKVMNKFNQQNDYLDTNQDMAIAINETSEKTNKNKENSEPKDVYYEAKYRDKIEARCKNQLNQGIERCRC